MKKKYEIAIIMGSKSDFRVMQEASEILKKFEVNFSMEIISAHRTPKRLYDFALNAQMAGYKVIIAGAGGAAHLPGMCAAMTVLPVIGVPISATKLAGLDSLLSIVQMPKGIPVATVAIDNAINAAYLALKMLAIENEKIRLLLQAHQENQSQAIDQDNEQFLN